MLGIPAVGNFHPHVTHRFRGEYTNRVPRRPVPRVGLPVTLYRVRGKLVKLAGFVPLG